MLRPKVPAIIQIDGTRYVSFKDIFINNIINTINNVDFQLLNQKAEKIMTRPMSPKHRKRLARQIKRQMGG